MKTWSYLSGAEELVYYSSMRPSLHPHVSDETAQAIPQFKLHTELLLPASPNNVHVANILLSHGNQQLARKDNKEGYSSAAEQQT